MKIQCTTEIEMKDGQVAINIQIPADKFLRLAEELRSGKKVAVKTTVKETVEDKKKRLYGLIKSFQTTHPTLYPRGLYTAFMLYWGETSKGGQTIRFEKEQYFDIAKRLLTFKNNYKEDELSKLWDEHNKQAGPADGRLF